MMVNNKIGLYFGSFNPITVGHLIVAKATLEHTDIDELWFVVSPQNPSKVNSGELEDAQARLNMVVMAVGDEPKMKTCDIEFEMPFPSYTADTLSKLREKHPETKFSIVVGTDTQMKMGNYWKKSEEILDMHDLIVYPREISEGDSKWKLTDKAHSVSTYLEDVPQINISSTLIRKNISLGISNRYLILDSVIEYIMHRNLYTK